MSFLHTSVALARPWRLPAIWSNCLAGWWLGGAGALERLLLLCGSATLLWLGAAFLNDALDADYDRLHHPSRPIPAGGISQAGAWRWGVGFLVAGALLLLMTGPAAGVLGLSLVLLVVLHHSMQHLKPMLEGLARLGLYGLGALFAEQTFNGWPVWCGLALAAYTAGMGCFSKWRHNPRQAKYWPVILLAIPIALALIMDVGSYRESGLLLSAVLGLWTLRCLRQTFWSLEPDVNATMAGLQAGIMFVDWLAACPIHVADPAYRGGREISIAFLVLFALTLALQKLLRRTS